MGREMNRLGIVWFRDESEIEFEREKKFWKAIEEVTSKVVTLCGEDFEDVIRTLQGIKRTN